MAPRKSTPKGIDPAYPQKNFVKAYYENRNDMDGFYKYMYGGAPLGPQGAGEIKKKASGYGHSIGQRGGKLRYSGTAGAHKIGKR